MSFIETAVSGFEVDWRKVWAVLWPTTAQITTLGGPTGALICAPRSCQREGFSNRRNHRTREVQSVLPISSRTPNSANTLRQVSDRGTEPQS